MDEKNLKSNNNPVDDLAEEVIEKAGEEIKASQADIDAVKEMISVGAMFGHKKTKTNPKFKNFIFTSRSGVEIIDLTKTLSFLEKAGEFLKDQIKQGKTIVFVATQPAAWETIENLAKKFNMPYVKRRWIGGLLTNFKSLSGRLEYFKKTKAGMAKGEFEKYTKKERSIINKNIAKMEDLFGGLENLTSLADVLFVVDSSIKGHMTAIREAKIIKIPIVAIIDSDDNPEIINYPIPANDHAKMSIDWIINKIAEKMNS
ncbi:30S ribosomal protein S2 [Candidatus Wolfebacteria bacterium]|nr:30S ribosomal protein S2 [Candidatus Wolfebacteria bacterium]